MRTLPLYCWNAAVAAILMKCGCCRYIDEMRTLPLYCWNTDVAAILLKCGRCRYIVEMRTLPLYCWYADDAAILCRFLILFASGLHRYYYLYNCDILLRILHAARLIINNVQHVISLCAIYWVHGGKFIPVIYQGSLDCTIYIAFGVMDIVKKSKSSATNRKYDIYFNKFKSWCLQFKLSHLPALPSTVSMYLTSLIQTGVSVAVLKFYFSCSKTYFIWRSMC
jgi:hypothetical protein